ncbi:MAG: peptidoglycan editing factor PgeF [Candidatus Xenobiia bacterium LiM19]
MHNEKSYLIKEKNGISLVAFKNLEDTGLVTHGFTTRKGGVSSPPFDSLNMGRTSGDRIEAVHQNRELLGRVLGYLPRESIELVHGRDVHVHREISNTANPVEADAVVTEIAGAPLTIFYADCVPVFILDCKRPAIALVHAGWRGTVANVVGETVEVMRHEYGSSVENCLFAIAPSIGPCCFAVDEDVAAQFLETFKEWKDLMVTTSNKCYINLWEINKRLIMSKGVPERNVVKASLCTSCNDDMFFSYRRDKRVTGRMAATIMLL